MLKIVIFKLEGSKFQKKCPHRIGTGSYSIGTTEKREIFNQKKDQQKATFWSWCVFFLIMCRVPILSGHLEFWGFRLFFWLWWGRRPGIGPKLAKRVRNTTKVGILAIVWGQISPSSSYSGWSGAYSIGTPCIYVCCCVQFRGVFSFKGSKMLLFLLTDATTFKQKKTCFPPVKPLRPNQTGSWKPDLRFVIQCVQKRGAHVAQHRHPILERF